MRKKAIRAETKGICEGTTQSIIHMQDLRQIYFVTNLGYEELRETATQNQRVKGEVVWLGGMVGSTKKKMF